MTVHDGTPDLTADGDARALTLAARFAERAALCGDSPAVIEPDGTVVSFAELDRRSNGLARHLQQLGVGGGDRIAVRMHRGADAVVCLLAALKAGAAYVPVDPRYPEDRQAYVMEHSRSAVVLTARSLIPDMPASLGVPVIAADERASWSEFDPAPLDVATGPDDAIYVIYTSGSTGRPKGVLGRQAGTLGRIAWGAREHPFGPDEVVAQRTSLMFVDHVWETFGPLLAGVPLAVVRDDVIAEPRALVELLAERRVSRIVLVPALVDAILDTGDDLAARLPALRHWVSSGEALRLPTVKRFHALLPQARLINLYGSSEVSADVTWYDTAELPDDAQAVPLGRPLDGVTITITGDDGAPVPAGVPGEIRVSGPAVALGYLDLPAETAERFSLDAGGEPAFRTGDLGRWNEDGVLDYRGRRDDQVKIRGNRVELGEIESVLRQHRDIAAASVALRERASGPALVAYVVSTGPLDMKLMRTYVRSRLPEYMVPAGFVSLAQLPMTPNGKVDRKALPETGELPLDETGYVAPVDDVQRAITAIFEQILDRRRIGIADDFFDLGGHSLAAARGIARIEDVTGVRLSIRDFFESPTPEGLAARVRSAPATATDPVDDVPEVAADALSLVQQRFWLFEQMRPDTALYNLPAVVRLRGSLSADALEDALRDVIERHASLRSTVRMGEHDPHLLVSPTPERVLDRVDLRDTPPDAVPGIVREEARRPFDLERGPLIRATLYRIGEQEHLFAPVMHHVVSDGASLGLFFRDLSLAYQARLAGGEPGYPALSADYQAFAGWQRRRLTPRAIERELEYWRAQLKTAPRLLDLPTDHPRRARQSFDGRHVPLELDANLASALRVLASDGRASLFMVLLAAFQAVLGNLAGQDDVVIGAPTAGRLERAFEDVIGLFINTLVLRGDLSGDPSFAELLARTRDTTLAAFEHQDIPFEELVDAIDIDRREGAFSPFFQNMLVLEPDPADDVDLPGVRATHVDVHVGASMFDISLYLVERRDGTVGGYAEYNSDIFERATVARVCETLTALLAAAAAAPGTRLGELLQATRPPAPEPVAPALPAAPLPRSLVALFAEQAAARDEAPAVVGPSGAVLSFGELDRRSNALARHLHGIGVRPGDRVAVRMRRGADAVVSLLAVLKAGAAYVPVDPRYPAERQAFVLVHSQSAAVLTERALLADMPAAANVPVIAADDAAAWTGFDAAPLDAETGPDDAIYVIYTSGSTGRPKGVLGRQAGTLNRIVWGAYAHPFGPDEVVAQRTSLAFVDSVWEIFGPLVAGVPIAVIPDDVVADPHALVTLLAERRVSRIVLVPALVDAILGTHDDLAARLPRLGHWVSSGETLRLPTVRRFREALPGARLINLYGSSEVSADVTWYDTAELAEDAKAVPLGHPLAGVTIALVDEHGEPVAPGAVGEIRVAGVAVALGYHDLPAETAERFSRDRAGNPAFRTGDLARWNEDGVLEHRGRRDDQVKIRGNRVELGEVESVLRRHRDISAAAVAVRERVGGPTLVAYVVTSGPLDMKQMRTFVRKRLPEYMVPTGFVTLAQLPQTPNGKVDRKALPDTAEIALDDAGYVAPADDLERTLVAIFEQILERAPIGATDDFFELGGHSLLAARLFRQIERRLGTTVPLSTLLEGASVEDIAKQVRLAQESPGQVRRALALRTQGTRCPLFLVPGAGSRLLYLRHLARHLGDDQPLYALHDDPSHGEPAETVPDLAARHIADMRAIQSHGPYALTGFSFGGVVAFEMAQQLVQAGERVSLLALLDTFHPAYPPPFTRPGVRGARRRLGHGFDLMRSLSHDDRKAFLRSSATLIRERQTVAAWHRMTRLSPWVAQRWHDPVGADERAWFARDSVALANYLPQPYPGRLTFFWAKHNTRTTDVYDTRRGWDEVAELDVVPLPGSHTTLLLEPLVQRVAQALTRLLGEAADEA